CLLFCSSPTPPRDLHSFPTRRSSDLAAIYLTRASKSNASYAALKAASADVREHGHLRPPDALRSAAYPAARKLGRGKGYVYPHRSEEHTSELQSHLNLVCRLLLEKKN